MPRTVQDRLRHIAEAIDRLERMTAGKTFGDLLRPD
jgi:uncharacterized protein with HEPN domain